MWFLYHSFLFLACEFRDPCHSRPTFPPFRLPSHARATLQLHLPPHDEVKHEDSEVPIRPPNSTSVAQANMSSQEEPDEGNQSPSLQDQMISARNRSTFQVLPRNKVKTTASLSSHLRDHPWLSQNRDPRDQTSSRKVLLLQRHQTQPLVSTQLSNNHFSAEQRED